MDKKVAIIIVNWNGLKFLKDCLGSVFAQTYQNFDVYFVDNGSIDDSLHFVKENFPEVKIIKLKTNTGFAKGSNEGIKEALKDLNVEYVVCLNNDTIVQNNWLKELVKTAEKDQKIGGVSSKAYFIGGEKIHNAGLIYSKALHINKEGGISLGYNLTDMDAPSLSRDIEIFAPGGVAPLYKREVLEKIFKRDNEIFDEDFFAYAEDYDLGFRIQKLGYKCYLSANAQLIHMHSQTLGLASPFKSYLCERNTILTAIKNLSLFDLLLFPLRNFLLKVSYLYKKNTSVKSLKSNIGFSGMILILFKAHASAFLLMPKFLLKRWKI